MQILFEDDDLLVINKPPGTVVNKAESVKSETIQDWMEQTYHLSAMNHQSDNSEFFDRAGIAHRLDKDTSGCLILAKTPTAFADVQLQFKGRSVKKSYRAIVHGHVSPQEGEIRAPIGRLPWNRMRFGIIPSGKEAVSQYRVLELLAHDTYGQYSSIEVLPETGRTHQIRVHVKHINHPILGDSLYAGRKQSRKDITWVPRVMLHAYSIAFEHPLSRKHLEIIATIPDDMERVLWTLHQHRS